MNQIKKERLTQLDFFRAIAIIGVLHVHSTSVATTEAMNTSIYYLFNFLNIFFKYGTPSFIFLSSFVLFYNYYDRPLTGKLIGSFYKKRMLYILLPYVLISALYFWYKLAQRGQLDDPPMQLLGDYWYAITHGSAYTHLYFVFISVQFYLLFPIMLALLKSQRWVARFAIPIGLALQWGFVIWNKYDLHYATKGSLAISYFSYYMMGAFVAIYFKPFRGWLMSKWTDMSERQRVSTILLWGSWLVTGLIYVQIWYDARMTNEWLDSLVYELMWNVYTMLSSLVLLHSAFILNRIAPKWILAILRRLGELSFAIYLVHPFILAYYRDTREYLTLGTLGYFVWIYGGMLCALIISAVFVQMVFRRVSFSWVLLGSIPASLSGRHKNKKQAKVSGRTTKTDAVKRPSP
ncbi:acyltransferase [Paenibacillus sp. PsM32]|uniref:Acyltransferase n=1 Tax=Paenibacillus kyungheensis TaxID=1452732 RepID=A0AAX3M1G8_9BACL|nr:MULTISPECIES: acyltransferase [Paenibacillus]MDN4619021.1 acyltransferase [Paenibacillus sp. PsM32]MDQ1236642.1 peptidoglycan/LPS O-acetylase OafA/YrhL [Paenibacillus sp. SORGH_AS_0306]MDR6109000.1 peptidoglycan/LPS O-acetylase OafA/YrhL [Paenibacillus sp. SORGH_AS_0338]WCT56060.1 acyltransferase [Paenibacillus kyungheensis]WDF50778.1 acyltransferase [Paenibacillus sp. KACC 21273]